MYAAETSNLSLSDVLNLSRFKCTTVIGRGSGAPDARCGSLQPYNAPPDSLVSWEEGCPFPYPSSSSPSIVRPLQTKFLDTPVAL